MRIVDPGFTWDGKPWRPSQNPMLLPPFGLDLEREIHYGRLEAARAFAAAHPVNRITVPTPDAWLGIAAAGKTYYDLREALLELGLDDAALRRYGIRLLKIGMLFPMETGIVREFARGLEELLVVEEKRAFVELFIRDVLYNQAERPRVLGKQDERERPLVPASGELDADRIAQIVVTPQRGNGPMNRTGNDATSAEEANFKVRMIMERLKAGAPFGDVAADYMGRPTRRRRANFTATTATVRSPT